MLKLWTRSCVPEILLYTLCMLIILIISRKQELDRFWDRYGYR